VKQLVWSENASRQLVSAYDFISEENPSAAAKQLEIILQAVEQLAHFPEMGHTGRVKGTKDLVIVGSPYIVAYRLKGRTVRILAVLHGARRWPTHF
jgi:addiction module RelE/StbE family toxin